MYPNVYSIFYSVHLQYTQRATEGCHMILATYGVLPSAVRKIASWLVSFNTEHAWKHLLGCIRLYMHDFMEQYSKITCNNIIHKLLHIYIYIYIYIYMINMTIIYIY